MSTASKECPCGQSFTFEADPELPWLHPSHCPECEDRRETERQAEAEREAAHRRDELAHAFTQRIDDMTPDRLLTPDLRHPAFNVDLWRKVSAWQPTRERPWLGLIGETGACKTRCAFLLLRQFVIDDAKEWDGHGKPPEFDATVITGMAFNRWCVERFSKESGEPRGLGTTESPADIATRSLRKARTADLLLFDELGKTKATPGTIDEVFALIDYRTSHNLVTIWTSNRPPQEFCASWPEEYAAPAAGRIIEASTIIRA